MICGDIDDKVDRGAHTTIGGACISLFRIGRLETRCRNGKEEGGKRLG